MILSLDFGATRVKSVVSNSLKKKYFLYTKGSLFYSNNVGVVKKDFFINTFKKHLDFYLRKKIRIRKIIICSEMHGFFYTKGSFISNYFSWRSNQKISFDNFFNNKNYKKMTGLSPKEGIPYFRIKKLEKIDRVFGIGEFICKSFGEFNNVIHSTYAQSLGIYYFKKKKLLINQNLNSINKDIIIKYGYSNCIGNIKYKDSNISLHGGIGDLQCSNNLKKLSDNQVLMNISTGSQLIFKLNLKKNYDYRISFDNKLYSCITHIPSGRYLLYLSKNLKMSKNNFFLEISNIDISELSFNQYLDYDLKKLNSKFKKTYKKFSKKKFLQLIIFIYANQYLKLLNNLKFDEIIITGGLSLYLKNLVNFLKFKYPEKTIHMNKDKDETIKFLLDNKSNLC